MTVAHLVPALFGAEGVVGGAERYVFELARHMSERVQTRLVSFAQSPGRRVEGALEIEASVPADSDLDLDRWAQVVADHLQRFGQRDELEVVWA